MPWPKSSQSGWPIIIIIPEKEGYVSFVSNCSLLLAISETKKSCWVRLFPLINPLGATLAAGLVPWFLATFPGGIWSFFFRWHICPFFFAQSHYLEFEVSVLFEGVKDVENEGDHQRLCRKSHNGGEAREGGFGIPPPNPRRPYP